MLFFNKYTFTFLILISLMNNVLGQEQKFISKLEIYDLDKQKSEVIYQENDHFEAPNWSPDGSYLLFNSHGLIYRYDLKEKSKEIIDSGFADKINNDHGISPDGKKIIISCSDPIIPGEEAENWLTSKIYTFPSSGGKPELITKNEPSFWHGWSPDGERIAYVGRRKGEFDIYSKDLKGGEEIRLTFEKGLDDGPDYSPDGKFIYYNSFSTGSMEIWRMNINGSEKVQLTKDSNSNWFPHPSPDGKYLVYLAYPENQGEQHPPLKKVVLRLMDLISGKCKDLYEFTGGQGTINVPSWHPGSRRFAFVTYEVLT